MNRKTVLAFFFLIVGILPVLAGYIVFNTPSVTAEKAMTMLSKERDNIVLIDVREMYEYDMGHIQSAINIPYAIILNDEVTPARMEMFDSKQVLVICENGFAGNFVTRKLRGRNVSASNIKGGLEAWIASAGESGMEPYRYFITARGDKPLLPFRTASSFEQWMAVITAFFLKPVYTTVSFLIFLIFLRKKEPEYKAIMLSMLFFFLGENSCAVNYLFFDDKSYLMEYLHSLGMLFCFGFFVYGVLEVMDKYFFHFENPEKQCSLVYLCKKCTKHQDVSCGLQNSFLFISIACSALALMPLFAELKMVSYNTVIWDSFYNYSHPVIYQVFENRICPIAAAIFFLSASIVLVVNRENSFYYAKLFFAAGAGPLFFSFFRFILYHGYIDNLAWMEVWEELTEFIFIAGVLSVIWFFRKSVFRERYKI